MLGVVAVAAGFGQGCRSGTHVFRQPAPDGLTLDLGDGGAMQLVRIPSGEFMMGSTRGSSDERPVHRVRITKPFHMGVTEVTVAQYRAFLRDGGDDSGVVWSSELCPLRKDETYSLSGNDFGNDDTQPMVALSWDGIQAFCRWLSQKSGRPVRLPTEAEWEYACRAGSSTAYCCGDDEARHDMHGNVWEACLDGYDSAYYRRSPPEDPVVPSDHSQRCDLVQFRVLRGGAWYLPAWYCRSASRHAYDVRFQEQYAFGFRIVLTAAP